MLLRTPWVTDVVPAGLMFKGEGILSLSSENDEWFDSPVEGYFLVQRVLTMACSWLPKRRPQLFLRRKYYILMGEAPSTRRIVSFNRAIVFEYLAVVFEYLAIVFPTKGQT